MEVFLIILLAIVVITSLVWLMRMSGHKLKIRRTIFLSVGLFGLILMIWPPKFTDKVLKQNVSIDSSISSNIEFTYKSIHELLSSGNIHQIDTIHLYGNDFMISDLQLIEEQNILHHPFPIKKGFVNVDAPSEVTEAENWRLSGQLSMDSFSHLELVGPDGMAKEIPLIDSEFFEANLNATIPGRYLYTINAIGINNDTITEFLPLIVKEKPKLQMLVMASSPGFELNYLKNYWVDKGHGFTQKLRVSKDKFRSIYLNAQRRNLENINKLLLDAFDVIIVDVLQWNELKDFERATILKKVEEDGLGIIILPVEVGDGPRQLPFIKTTDVIERVVSGTVLNSYSVGKDKSWSELKMKDEIMGFTTDMGVGRLVLPTITDSYRLLLNNDMENYQAIWAEIFNSAFADVSLRFSMMAQQYISEGELTELTIIDLTRDPEFRLNGEDKMLPARKIPFVDYSYDVVLMPNKGWNVIDNEKEEIYFYANAANAWNTKKQIELLRYISALDLSKAREPSPYYETKKNIPWYAGFLVFLIGFGLIWLDERGYG